jgi:predicted amidohydrolase YtcJ
MISLDPSVAKATAVAVVKGRILAVGTLESVEQTLGKQRFIVDTTFTDH